ncbi:MAG: hypothetical protein QM793_04555 [Muricomes sp.]
MENYSEKELNDALKFMSSTIMNCEKMQLKFAPGVSQHTLLKNRIKALYISKDLIAGSDNVKMYTKSDLEKALPPVLSIISKTKKAQIKYEEGTSQYRRFSPTIRAMIIAKDFLENEISKRGKLT